MKNQKTIWIINQYSSTPQTGMAGRHYYLAKYLARKGYKVYLIAAAYTHLLRKPPRIKSEIDFQEIEGFNFVWVDMPTYKDAHSKKRIFNWFLFSWKLLKLKKYIEDRPDSVMISSPSLVAFWGARSLARYYKAKLIFEVRDIWPLTLIEVGGYSKRHPFIMLMQWLEDKAYKDADRVISNLPYAFEHMITRGMHKKKFTWIPNGIDLEEMSTFQDIPSIVKDKIPKNAFVVGYTGTLGVVNAIDILIEAAILLKDNSSISFVLVGDGKEKAKLQEKVKKHHLKNVVFIDPIPKEQVQSMLSYFDACIIGGPKNNLHKWGVSPNKLFDYLYSKKPVLYSLDSGKYNPIKNSNSGISFEPGVSQELVKAILKFSTLSKVERENMGENARRHVLTHHDYSKLADKLIECAL